MERITVSLSVSRRTGAKRPDHHGGKRYGTFPGASGYPRFVGERTQILCVMNGVESEENVAAVYGWEHTLYSYMRVSIVMKDGKADFDPYWGKVHFGEARNEELTERVKAVQEVFERCRYPL